MPLVNVFLGAGAQHVRGKLQVAKFHDFLASKEMFAVPFGILQVNVFNCQEMYPEPRTFISMRCKGTKERTPEKLKQVLADTGKYLEKNGINGRIRLETFNPDLQMAVSFGMTVEDDPTAVTVEPTPPARHLISTTPLSSANRVLQQIGIARAPQ